MAQGQPEDLDLCIGIQFGFGEGNSHEPKVISNEFTRVLHQSRISTTLTATVYGRQWHRQFGKGSHTSTRSSLPNSGWNKFNWDRIRVFSETCCDKSGNSTQAYIRAIRGHSAWMDECNLSFKSFAVSRQNSVEWSDCSVAGTKEARMLLLGRASLEAQGST